ncbi:MAG: hypothetical protein RSG52_02420 [Terrisporobacter sp.]|uniref:hypothetical protein n=1 Tax=Terrisporobacter sp. TaxID=1965305 RepID=UPI002FCA7A5F
MSKNILELLVDSVWDCGVTACKMISKVLGLDWNEHDFQKFFNVVQLKNSEGASPKLVKKNRQGLEKIFIFDIPVGLTLSDFNSKLNQLSFFMKTNEESLSFEVLEDLSGVKLKVLCFNEFFRLYELKNSDGIHPKFKNKNSNK